MKTYVWKSEKPTFLDYEKKAKQTCPMCDTILYGIEFFEHEGGWEVAGYDERVWLYKHCPSCRYDWSLIKLNVER